MPLISSNALCLLSLNIRVRQREHHEQHKNRGRVIKIDFPVELHGVGFWANPTLKDIFLHEN